MAIIGSNALLNQYAPTFFIKDLKDGQTLRYDSRRKAYVNSDRSCGCNAPQLSGLADVDPSVGNPYLLKDRQVLMYDLTSGLWVNSEISFNDLLNNPVNSDYTFLGLGDTDKTPLPDGYVMWDSTGTQLIYTSTISATSVTGISKVGMTGEYADLLNAPVLVDVAITTMSGIGSTFDTAVNPNSIVVYLDNITPSSVAAVGDVTGANLSGTNTGDQTFILTGDVTGTGQSGVVTTLATVNSTPGSFGNSNYTPVITVNEKGLITNVSEQPTVSSVKDLVDPLNTLYISPRTQYIITSRLEILGRVENLGRIAIL